jgi:predicted ATPase
MLGGIELVGREAERHALGSAILIAAGGDGGILLLAGEGGVGKSMLVEATLAEAGGSVLRGTTDPRVVRPYAPVISALRGYARAVPEGLRGSGPLSGHLALILPELGSRPPDTDQATLFEAVGDLLEQITNRNPTVIFLDDLQWVDGATAELLLHLDRRFEAAPVLILGVYRSEEVGRGHPLRKVHPDHLTVLGHLHRAGDDRDVDSLAGEAPPGPIRRAGETQRSAAVAQPGPPSARPSRRGRVAAPAAAASRPGRPDRP